MAGNIAASAVGMKKHRGKSGNMAGNIAAGAVGM